MNLVLVERNEVDKDDCVQLGDRRAEHLLKVLRVQPGQHIAAGIIDGPHGKAEVTNITKVSVTLRLHWCSS